MTTKKSKTPAPEVSSDPITPVVITEVEKTRAALNLPTNQFMLGDKVFTISDLSYDDYLRFIQFAQPLIETLISKVVTSRNTGIKIAGLNLSPEQINIGSLIQTLGNTLPEMAQLICKNTDPDITVEEVKKLAKTPFPLANAVFMQVKQNGMIKDFSDFFGLMTKALKASSQSV